MERQKIISRRGFLGTMLSAGCITGFDLPQTKSDHPGSPFLPELISTLNDQASRHRNVLAGEQIENLTYAYHKITPRTHQEATYVVALGMPVRPTGHLADEYVRRGYQEPSRLFDHPLLELRTWGLPDTRRILIFREQCFALVQELVGVGPEKAKKILYSIYGGAVNEEHFWSETRKSHPHLNKEIARNFLETLRYYFQISMPYAWCSTMVERAGRFRKIG